MCSKADFGAKANDNGKKDMERQNIKAQNC